MIRWLSRAREQFKYCGFGLIEQYIDICELTRPQSKLTSQRLGTVLRHSKSQRRPMLLRKKLGDRGRIYVTSSHVLVISSIPFYAKLQPLTSAKSSDEIPLIKDVLIMGISMVVK